MITKNWYSYFSSVNANMVISNAAKTTDGTIVNCGYSLSNATTSLDSLMLHYTSVIYKITTSGIVLGSGTTPPTINDFRLESQITSGLHCSVASVYHSEGYVTRNITATNISDHEITIAEIGYQCQIYTGENTSSGSKFVLMDRSLLQTPVTIPVGGVGVISYTVRIIMPE